MGLSSRDAGRYDDRNMLAGLQKILNKLHKTETGFTLIELLVVMGILGILAGVAIPMIITFADKGRPETAQTELQNIRVAVAAMLVESDTKELTPASDVSDMDTVVTTDTPALILSDYLSQLNPDGTTKTELTYSFAADGTVTQNTP
jgi:prepilin-type N-terminal cleavage/methylation domain-containing protein